VTSIPKGGAGAREFHKRRSEIITVEEGSFRLVLEDVRRRTKAVVLKRGMTYGIIGPYVLHTYVALSNNSSLHVVANTLYDHSRVETYDSYPESDFRKLQDATRWAATS
jgi:dTDP-4-dehydrorhamnose 3,5-epimerase-like enzyme